MSDNADEQAKALLMSVLVPLYPVDKPLDEMTPTERGILRQLIPAVAAALREAQEHCDMLKNSGLSYCYWRDVAVPKLQAERDELEADNINHREHAFTYLAERDALKEQLERKDIERDEMKRTYDKTVERLERELAYCKRLAIEADNRDDARMAAAKVEGLREAANLISLCSGTAATASEWIENHIASLERGSSAPEEQVQEIPQDCEICGDESGYLTLVCGSCFNEMIAAIERGKD